MRWIVLPLFLLFLTFLSCQRETNGPLTTQLSCNNFHPLDSQTVRSNLLGNWKWLQRTCFWTGSQVTPADKLVQIRFLPNQTFTVTEAGIQTKQGSWSLQRTNDNNWILAMNPASEYLYGLIRFCDSLVVFADSYVDGCDHLFRREP